MLAVTTTSNNKPFVFKSFQDKAKTKNFIHDFRMRRRKVTDEPEPSVKLKIAAGSIIGAAIPMVIFAKKQKLDVSKLSQIFNVNFGLKEMLGLTTGSILGGVLTGMMFDKKNSKKEKTDEGVFQFLNSTIPLFFVSGIQKLSKNFPVLEKKPVKIGAIGAGIFASMHCAAKLANFINDPHNKVPDRKLGMLDAVVNIDEVAGALVLAGFPIVKTLKIEKLLPFISAWSGYRAGESN